MKPSHKGRNTPLKSSGSVSGVSVFEMSPSSSSLHLRSFSIHQRLPFLRCLAFCPEVNAVMDVSPPPLTVIHGVSGQPAVASGPDRLLSRPTMAQRTVSMEGDGEESNRCKCLHLGLTLRMPKQLVQPLTEGEREKSPTRIIPNTPPPVLSDGDLPFCSTAVK